MTPSPSVSCIVPRFIKAAGILSLGIAGILATAQPSFASPILYTETGTMTGSIGATPFTAAAVTLTTIADTANITFITVGPFLAYENAGTTTITIAGVGTATFTGADLWGAFSQEVPGTGVVGIGNITTTSAIIGNFVTIPPFYDLSTPTTLTGLVAKGPLPGLFKTTTLGDLTVTGVSGNATFTAVSAVPEPATIVSAGVAFLFVGMWAMARRRRLE
jgi:hypothetical protein